MGPEDHPGKEFDPDEREQREIAGRAAGDAKGFLGLMGHLYRGAMNRSTTWRDRLDRTSNWSVVIVASLLTWAFSQDNPHSVLLLGMGIVSLFLYIEARRYRMYDVWRSRVRMLEENVFANALNPAGVELENWRALLSEDLRRPTIKVPLREAVARRLRRIYLPLLLILLIAWLVRLTMLSSGPKGFVEAASTWLFPGLVVIAGIGLFYAALILLAAWPAQRTAMGELRESEVHGAWRNDS